MTSSKSQSAWWALPILSALVMMVGMPKLAWAATDDDEEAVVEEIIVTGSRVKRSDYNSSSPITVVTGDSLLESGFGDIAEALRQQVSAGTGGFNQSSVLSGGGSTSIDLRNIGQSRALILINGKRVASFADALSNQAADLSFVPNALVDRVEILRDGASAAYGSDAISGVINVILKERFEGIEAGVSTGVSGEGDGERYTANFAMGAASDRGSIMLGGEYRYTNNINQRDRDWAAPAISFLGEGVNIGGFPLFINGSGANPGGLFVGDTSGALYCTQPKAFGGDEITNIFPNCRSSWTPRDASTRGEFERYDYSLQQDLWAHSKVLSTAAYGTYEFHEGIEGFMEVEFAKRRSVYNLDGNPIFAGSGTVSVPNGWRVPATNPNNEFGEAGGFQVRPTTTIGKRQGSAESNTVRVVTGIRGEIFNDDLFLNDWSYELSWIYTRVDASVGTNSTFNLVRANTISDPDACAASTICSAAVNPSGALDVFRPGNWTQSEIEYMRLNTLARNEFQTSGWFGSLNGSIMELPAGEVQLAIGFETRTEEGLSKPDSVVESGESVSNQVFSTKGSFTVDEFFAELEIPLLADQPFADRLDLNAQFRYSDYSNFGAEETYRFGLNWQINPSVRIRGNVSTAYRAPQITDLFGGGTVSFDFFSHPCAQAQAAGSVQEANCLLDGLVPGAQAQVSSQFGVLAGSNANLTPETADTAGLGIVFTPEFLDGFSMSIDFWDIEVDNLINRPTSDSVVDACYDGPAGQTAPECARFTTGVSPSGISVIGLTNALVNQDGVSTSGYDLGARYEFDSFAGTVWTVDLNGTYVVENTFYPGAGGADDRGSIPRIRANLNAHVDWQQWDFRWGIRYVHGMDDPRYDGDNAFNYSGPDAHTEHDLTIGYNFGTYRAVFGVTDVFDNDPPYVFSSGNNSDLFLYDPIGRYMFLRLTANL